MRPVSIFDDEFESALKNRPDKAVASEMEHALRYTIRINIDKDPIYYKSLAEKLEKIIAEHRGEWDKLVEKLSKFKQDMQGGREILEVFSKINCNVCMAYYDMFFSFYDGEVSEKTKDVIIELVINSLGITVREMARVDFWGTTGAESRNRLQNYLVGLIAATKDAVLIKNIPAIKERFMSLTKENQKELQGLNLDN